MRLIIEHEFVISRHSTFWYCHVGKLTDEWKLYLTREEFSRVPVNERFESET